MRLLRTSLTALPLILAVACGPGREPPLVAAPGATAAERVVLGADHVAGWTIGADIDAVITAVSAVLGPALEDGPAACPGGADRALRWPGGLQVQARGRALSGWVWHDRGARRGLPIATDAGIALGDAIAALLAAHGTSFQWFGESTLGAEFAIGAADAALGGLATGTAAQDTVTAFFAADSCSHR